jgi:hypothetical protein
LDNADEELTRHERIVVDHAKKHYRRFVFRHGHLIAWLLVPMAAVLFVPAMHPYQNQLSILIVVVLLLAQSFTSARVIGKLATTVDRDRNIEPEIQPRKAGFSLRSRPGLLFYILLFPIIFIGVGSTEPHFTWGATVFEVIAIECALGMYVAIITILVGILGMLSTKNERFYDKVMAFGGLRFGFLCWLPLLLR